MSPGACGGALKKVLLLLGIMSVMLLPLPGSVSSSVDLVSRYVWRGFDLLPDNRPAIQPALDITLGKSGLTFGVWSSFALAKWSEYREANEIDLYLAYKFAMPEGWDLSAGVYLYSNWFTKRFRFKNGASLEAYATLARTDLPLSPELAVYYDFNLGSGLYVTLGGGQQWTLGDKASLEAGGRIGFNSRQYIDRSGFTNIDLTVGTPLALGWVTLTPSLNVMIPLMDEVNEDVEFWFGISAALGN